MRHRFGYDGPEGRPFDVPPGHDATLHRAALPTTIPNEDGLLREALASPIRAPPLDEAIAGARRVLLLVDDGTRGTPVHRILPHLEDALRGKDVTLLTAQGTHRRMSPAELDAKLGPCARRWRIAQHDWRDEEAHVRLGETRGGMPIVVNRLVAEADLVLGIGQVGVHAIMGYSGGAKIVHPGVSGAATEAWTHWEANWRPTEALMGVLENPIRLEIEEGARKAGLAAVLNVVLDARGRVHHAVHGHPVHAQRAAAHAARRLHETRVGEPVDVVVTDSRPADRDYWQSAKGLYCATLAVKEGGSIVMASPNPEGVADNHPELLDLAGLPLDEIRARVARGEVGDVIAAAVAAYTARIRERSDVHLVSSGIAPALARRLGFTPHADVQSALGIALAKAGPGARVAILDGAGSLLPRVRGRNDHLDARPEPGRVKA